MTPILNHNDPAAAAPSPSRDVLRESGVGNKTVVQNSSAPMAVRTTRVSVTNPAMKAAARSTPAVREEGRRIVARAVDVNVRSGNNEPGQAVDASLAQPGFIWGLKGEGDQPQVPAGQKYGLLALVGVGLVFAFIGFKAGGKG